MDMDAKFEKIIEGLAELEDDDFIDGINEAIAEDKSPQDIVDACAIAMDKVGDYFEEGEYFVGDLVYAADMLAKAMEILDPLLGGEKEKSLGKVVVGTVQGDLHDIGKNIYASMMQAAGFQVFDLGVDVPPERFVEKVREVSPDIVGMSGLLTLSVETMKRIKETLEKEGMSGYKIMIGGNIVNERAREYVGADAWSTNASKGVKQCKAWVES